MKLLQFTIILILTTSFCFSQNEKILEKGTISGEFGIGLGIHKTKYKDNKTNETDNDTTGFFYFPLLVDYNINHWFSAGGGFIYKNYIEGDSASSNGVNAFDVVIKPAFHFLNTRRLDFYASAFAGMSYFSYKSNDLSDIDIRGFGSIFGGGLTTRFFFSNSIGMFLNYTYSSVNYKHLKGTAVNGITADLGLSHKGGMFGIGLTFKIK